MESYIEGEVPYPENRAVLESGKCPFLPPTNIDASWKMYKLSMDDSFENPLLNSVFKYYMLNNMPLTEAREGLKKLRDSLARKDSDLAVSQLTW